MNVVIAEMAGRDSVAALVKYCEELDVDRIVPTYVFTGTEYGEFSLIERNLDFAKGKLPEINFSDLVVLRNTELWRSINGRFISHMVENFGFYSPCPGCHLFLHLIRLPLYFGEGVSALISGEREYHLDCVKFSQRREFLDVFREVLASANANLEMPLRFVRNDEDIERLLGSSWGEDERQMSCLFSRNYFVGKSSKEFEEKEISKYVDDFLKPVGKLLAKMIVGSDGEYMKALEEFLWQRR